MRRFVTTDESKEFAKLTVRAGGQLIQTLNAGIFSMSARLPATLPGLEIAHLGSVGLPVEKRYVTALRMRFGEALHSKGLCRREGEDSIATKATVRRTPVVHFLHCG